MFDPNDIAEDLVSSRFKDHFEEIRDATQGSILLQEEIYASSQIVCVKKHRPEEECNCICSTTNTLDRLYVRDRDVPIKKRKVPPNEKRKRDKEDENNDDYDVDDKKQKIQDEQKGDDEILESPFCVPVEEHVYVTATKTRRASKNLYNCVYLLQSTVNPIRTYCGITNNRAKRIRQHNGEIVGGARFTRKDRPWRMVAILNGFETLSEAAKFEWSMHHPGKRRLRKPYIRLHGRLNCMNQLLQSEPWIGRWNNDPLKVIIDGVEFTGDPKDHAEFLKGLENHCDINYAPQQLRWYYAPTGECLAKKNLCELELNFTK